MKHLDLTPEQQQILLDNVDLLAPNCTCTTRSKLYNHYKHCHKCPLLLDVSCLASGRYYKATQELILPTHPELFI